MPDNTQRVSWYPEYSGTLTVILLRNSFVLSRGRDNVIVPKEAGQRGSPERDKQRGADTLGQHGARATGACGAEVGGEPPLLLVKLRAAEALENHGTHARVQDEHHDLRC